MRLQKISYCLLYVVLASFLLIFLWNEHSRARLQTSILIEKLHSLSSRVVGITVYAGEYKEYGSPCYLNQSDLEVVLDAFLHADDGQIGGHNRSLYDGVLHCKLRDGSNVTLLGSVHKNNKVDLFITDSLWKQRKDGVYYRSAPYRARIPLLGEWFKGVIQSGKGAPIIGSGQTACEFKN